MPPDRLYYTIICIYYHLSLKLKRQIIINSKGEIMSEETKEKVLTTEEEEIKRAEELLNSSRSKRKKINSESKKKETKDTKPAKDKAGKENKFLKNPIIPITLLALIAVLAFGVFYFASQAKPVAALGFTYDEFRDRYKATSLYQDLFCQFDCELPPINYTTGAEGKNKDKLDFFASKINNNFTTLNVGVQGSCRKTDGQIVALRFLFETSEDNKDEVYLTITMYYRMVISAVYPDANEEEVNNILTDASKDGTFKVRGDIAYRLHKEKIDDKEYFVLDFAPATEYKNIESASTAETTVATTVASES